MNQVLGKSLQGFFTAGDDFCIFHLLFPEYPGLYQHLGPNQERLFYKNSLMLWTKKKPDFRSIGKKGLCVNRIGHLTVLESFVF